MPMRISKKDALTIYRLLEASVPTYAMSIPNVDTWRKNKRVMMSRLEERLTAKDVTRGKLK